jgi:DNA helicase HerA-like ATPase
MLAVLGIDNRNKAVQWQPESLINPHVIVTGMSGVGKTHFLRSMISQIVSSAHKRIRVHVVDVHGDIDIPGAHALDFTPQMPYGFNPLVIDPNPHSGGVNAAIARFLRLLSKTANYKIGDRQEAVMRALLTELYERKGFFVDNVNSWRIDDGYNRRSPKTFPNVSDAYRFASNKFEQMFFGGNTKTLACLREVAKKQKSVLRQAGNSLDKSKSVLENDDFVKALGNLQDSYNEYFENIHKGTGQEYKDIIRYPSKELLASVVDRLEKLHFMGVFSGDTPPFNPNAPIWRYKMNLLDRDTTVLFAHTLAESIFRNSVRNGEYDGIREIIVLDEAKRFQDESPDSIFNIIPNEARKFGLALFSSSQSHSHFTQDAIQSSATSIILRQDDSNFNKVKALTNVDIDDLKTLAGRQTAMIKMNRNSGASSGYERVTVNSKKTAAALGISEAELSPSTFDSRMNSTISNDPFAMTGQTASRQDSGFNDDDHYDVPQRQSSVQPAPVSAPVAERKPSPAAQAAEIDIPDVSSYSSEQPSVTEFQSAAPQSAPVDEEAESLINSIFGDDDDATDSGSSSGGPAPQSSATSSIDMFNLNPTTVQRPQPAKQVDVLEKLKSQTAQSEKKAPVPADDAQRKAALRKLML